MTPPPRLVPDRPSDEFRVVPALPTPDMLRAGIEAQHQLDGEDGFMQWADAIYAAMIAAAPPAEAPAERGAELRVLASHLIGIASHLRACPAYSKLIGDAEYIEKAASTLNQLAAAPAAPAEWDMHLSLIGCAHLIEKNHPEVCRVLLQHADALMSAPRVTGGREDETRTASSAPPSASVGAEQEGVKAEPRPVAAPGDCDEIDDAIQSACREIQAALRRLDDSLKGRGVEVAITVNRHESGEWGVFAQADVPESIQ